MTPTIYHGTPQARFWAKVDVRGPDECWPWRAALNRSGYGRYTPCAGAKQCMATHYMLALVGRLRPSPDGCALHTCDNPICVNPSHLHWGTHRDNMRDKASKGRASRMFGPRNGMHTTPEARLVGERNPHAKLREAQVRAILTDGRRNAEIAGDYSVSPALVAQIKRGVAWRHVSREGS